MNVNTTKVQQCQRCHVFELIFDERSHRDNDIEWCLVCGFVRDDKVFRCMAEIGLNELHWFELWCTDRKRLNV